MDDDGRKSRWRSIARRASALLLIAFIALLIRTYVFPTCDRAHLPYDIACPQPLLLTWWFVLLMGAAVVLALINLARHQPIYLAAGWMACMVGAEAWLFWNFVQAGMSGETATAEIIRHRVEIFILSPDIVFFAINIAVALSLALPRRASAP